MASAVEEGLPLLRRRNGNSENDDGKATDGSMTLRIKATDGKEYRVAANAEDTIFQLKKTVSRVAAAEGKFVRLIASGRLLAPDDAALSSFKVVTDNSFIHVVVSNMPPHRSAPSAAAGQPLPSVDGGGRDDEDSSDDDDDTPRLRRGFDRLRDAGMTRSEVAALRAYFSPQVRRYLAGMPAILTAPSAAAGSGSGGGGGGSINGTAAMRQSAEDDEAVESYRLLQAEEEWMAAQGEASEFAVNTSNGRGFALGGLTGEGGFRLGSMDAEHDVGGTRDFMFGLVMGFFLGFIMLFWLFEGAVPQRQKLGIMAGVLAQLGLNFLKRAWQEDAA